jgi:formate dehydrogenase gamma subunit
MAALVAAAAALAGPLRGAEAIPNSDCLQCHEDQDLTKTNRAGRVVSLYVHAAQLAASRHATNTCVSCHTDIQAAHPDDGVAPKPVACAACHRGQSESFGASVHGLALQEGAPGAATCQDCHGSHEILPPSSPASPLDPSHLAAICGACHEQAANDLRDSVHGQALAAGRRDAPTCTDCHSEHRIEPLKGLSPIRIAQQTCSRCHASERLNTKYKLPPDRVRTFLESYHGLAAQLGSTRAANCASCHGVHQILPSSDPRSSIHRDHLVETCGKCHPGANANFALSKIHLDDRNGGDLASRINRWVRRVYLGLIVGLIGLFAVHNGLQWWRKAQAARRAQGAQVLRMDRSQRIQHALLLGSFIVLALTGFALKYPDSWLAWLLGADETVRRWSHRVAALVLVGVGGYHLAYLALTSEGRRLVQDLWPRKSDLTDLATHARYLIGRSPHHARFGRFGYPEKMEYWAVAWGTVIMGLTGFMIWFPVQVSRLLPRWAVDVALTIHYYEAILACLAIVVWHFYHVIFDPAVYPLNWSFWNGKVSQDWYRQEHPLDQAALPTAAPEATPSTPTPGPDPATSST